MDSDSERAEADVTEYRYVDRGEEFLDVEETPPQTIVFRSVHRSHTSTGTTATSVQTASPSSLVASSGYDSSASTDTQLSLVTSRSAESPDAVDTQSVTLGSLVTSSGYDSSASTDTRDFTFCSPVTSPERDPTASSDIAGASGGFLVTSSGDFPPSPQDTQSATDSSLLVSTARDSETTTDVQGFSDISLMTSSDQSWSVGRPEVEPCSVVHGDVGGEPSEAEHRGQIVEGHSDSDQGDDADREEGDEGSSEDGEISDEDLVSSCGEDFDADVLSAFSVTTETAAETADGGELDDSAAAKGSAFSTSEIVDETTLSPDTELETEADTFSLDATTYVDRWEGYLGSEDLPRVATIVFHRVREDDREDEGEGNPDAHSSIASAGTLTAKEETHSTSATTYLHVETVSPTSDYSTDLTAPHVGGERGSSVEVIAADSSLSVVSGAGAVPVSDSRSVSSVYVDYRKTVDVDVDSAVTRVDKTKDTQDAGSEQTMDNMPSEEGDRGGDEFSDKRDANTDTVRDTTKPTTTTTPVTDDRKTTSPEDPPGVSTTKPATDDRKTTSPGDPPGVPTTERHGPASLGPRSSYRREVVSQDGPELQRSQRDGDTPRYISTLCIPPDVPRNAETKPPPSDTDTEEKGGVEDGSSSSEAGDISEGATATASLARRGRESHTVTASLHRSFGATFDVGRPKTATTTHTAAAAAVGTVTMSAGQWSQVSQVTTSYLQGDGRSTENRVRQWATAGTETGSESEVFVREERSETAALHDDAERLVMQTGARGDVDIGVGSAGGAQTDPSVGETRIEPDDNKVGTSDVLCSASDAEASQKARSLEASEEERESGKLCYFSQKVSDDDDTSDDEGDSRKVSHLDIFVSDYSEQEKYAEYRDLHRSEDYSQDENYTKHRILIQRRDYSQHIEYAEHKDYAKHEDEDEIDREHYPEQDDTKHKDDTRHKDETKYKDYLEVHFHYPGNEDYLDATGDTTHTDYTEHTVYSTHEDYSEHEEYPEHKEYSELEDYSEDKEYSEQTDHSALRDSDHEDHSGHEDDDTGTASAMATEAADPVGRPTSHDEWFVDRGEEFVASWEPHQLSHVQFRLSPQTPDSDTVCSFEGTASIDASSLTLERPVDTADESVEDERKEKEEDEDTKEEKAEEEEEEEEVCDEPEVQDDLSGDEIDVQNASDDDEKSEPSEDEDDDRDEDNDTATGVAHSSDMRVGEKSEADVSALTTERYEGHAGPAATMESATMAAPSKLREEDDDEERKEESENGDEEREADDETDEEEYMDENADDEFEVTMTPDDTDRTPASGGFFISDDSGSSDDADEEPPPGDQAPREEGGEEIDVAKDAGVEAKGDRTLGAVDTDSETAVQKVDDGDADDNKEDARDRGTGDVEGLEEEGREDEEEEVEHGIREREDEVVGKEEEGLEEEEDEEEEEEVEHEIKERDDEVVGKEEEGLEEEKEEEDEEEEVEHEIKERDDEVVGKEEEGLEEEKEEEDEEEEVEHEIEERDDEVVGKEEKGLEEEKEEDDEEEEVEHEIKERDDEMVGKEKEGLEEEEEKEEEDEERKMKQEVEETGDDALKEEEEVGTEQESVIRPPLVAEAGDSVTLSAQSGTDDKDSDQKYILQEHTELLVGAGGGGDDGSGDDDDDDDHDDSDTDAAEQKMPEFRDTEDLDTREAAVSEDEEEKSGDDDTLDNLAETVCGASSLEDRAADSSARETDARADTVVGPQPTEPCELSDISALTRQGVDVRFVDRGEEFAEVFFRPTVKRERDGGSSPSEPEEQVRRD